MKDAIRNFFKSQPQLFFIWYKLYRSRRGVRIKWFQKDTIFYFDGYPRSGNTYLSHLFKYIYEKDKIIHHFHAIAPLKISLNSNLKSIILIRNPKDAALSNYLKSFELKSGLPEKVDCDLLKTLLKDYLHYYNFIKNNHNKILLIDFKMLVTNPESTIVLIDNYLGGLSGLNKANLKNKIGEVKMISFGSKTNLGSSKPSQIKEALKKNVESSLVQLADYHKTNDLYNELTQNLMYKNS